MKNGEAVGAFERAFADYVGARYAIALCNGTATLHTALVALDLKPGMPVAVPPLTMSATTIAVLHACGTPIFRDIDARTWLMRPAPGDPFLMPVELYGLQIPTGTYGFRARVYDGAQALYRQGTPEQDDQSFRSYSFQASKLLPLGEGGMLTTNSEALAVRAREFSSLGYRMAADQPRIDPCVLKSPTYSRHYSIGWNYRMSDLVAERGLRMFQAGEGTIPEIAARLAERQEAALYYRMAVEDCPWLTPQYIPDGWMHDQWTFAVACDTPERAGRIAMAVAAHGGERPFPAWRLAYHEPALEQYKQGPCPVAEDLQPRLLQFQTNSAARASRNAVALRIAIHGEA